MEHRLLHSFDRRGHHRNLEPAQQRNIFLSLTGILWFLVMLFAQYIPRAYNYHIASGMPSIGALFLYVVLPVFIILSFFTARTRR